MNSHTKHQDYSRNVRDPEYPIEDPEFLTDPNYSNCQKYRSVFHPYHAGHCFIADHCDCSRCALINSSHYPALWFGDQSSQRKNTDFTDRVRSWTKFNDQQRQEIWPKITPIERETIFKSLNAQERWLTLLDTAVNTNEREFWGSIDMEVMNALVKAQSYTSDKLKDAIWEYLTPDQQQEWNTIYSELSEDNS